jgi:glucokinase-like ROK family protein
MNRFHTASIGLIKDINTATILRIIREKGPVSRADITKKTGLNPATVSSNVANLLELGIIREIGAGQSSGGRKPTLLELDSSAYYVIGVDMGTTQVSTAVTDMEGSIRCQVSIPFEGYSSPEDIMAIMCRSIEQAIDSSGVSRDKLLGIGMGIHGLVDSENGVSVFAPAFQWEHVPIKQKFMEAFGLPVEIDNDVRAMALGEKWFGRARQVSNFIFMNIGTGIGSGIYVHGELLRGAHFGAGEIGHVYVADNKETCYCGISGCLSTLASGPAMARRAAKRVASGESSLLSELSKGELSRITGEMISQAAQKGDPLSREVLYETGFYIGQAISILINVLNPEMILVGGGVSKAGEPLFQGIREAISSKSLRNNAKQLIIDSSELGERCGMVGAATLVLKNIFMNPYHFQ